MGIKGKTLIELKDVVTGEVKQYEDSNMVTNALNNFLDTYGTWGASVFNDYDFRQVPMWRVLLGGLFLFDKAITANVDNTFMPAGVSMVGNGSYNLSNSSEVTEMGSFNNTESGVQSDGSIKFVYDFSTAQANGTIACACLTSSIGGYIGMGNASGKYITNSNYAVNTYQKNSYAGKANGLMYQGSYSNGNCMSYMDVENDVLYAVNPRCIYYSSSYTEDVALHWKTTKKIQVLKLKAKVRNTDVKDAINTIDTGYIIETYNLDIPQVILDYGASNDYVQVVTDSIAKNIYIVFAKSYQTTSGSNFYVMKIDSNMTVTAHKITNNTGVGLNTNRNESTLSMCFNGDYLWLQEYSGNYKLFGIKYTDSTQIVDTGVKLESWNGSIYSLDTDLICIAGGYGKARMIYDAKNNTMRYINALEIDTIDNMLVLAGKKGVYLANNQGNKRSEHIILKDPRYLATINNLDEPVVKTASQTMKVTYTITFE